MKRFPAPSRITLFPIPATRTQTRLWMPTLALLIAASTGCYHSSGIQRPPLVAEEIPSVLGDQVGGYKASAAPGDYFLGSDSIQLTVSGTPFGSTSASSGSIYGGSILDAGTVLLDLNYRRVSTPSDRLERLTPVINQDPDLPLVFTSFQVTNDSNQSSITAKGGLYDPQHKVSGANWDDLSRVSGVTVTHTVSLSNLVDYATLTTTLTNTGSAKLGIYNLGDYLFQQGGGFRFNIPASMDYEGYLLKEANQPYAHRLRNDWGVDIPASGPGTVFGAPYNGVVASMVGLMGNEPAADMDYHCSLGILPVTDKQLLVTSGPQPSFTDSRPKATSQLVMGSLPITSASGSPALDPGASITFTRRLYIIGGNSSSYRTGYYAQTLGQAAQATGLFNRMAIDQYLLLSKEFGSALFYADGTAQKDGPMQTEIRIERYIGQVDPLDDEGNLLPEKAGEYLQQAGPENWELERTEWLEPDDLYASSNRSAGFIATLLPSGDTAKGSYYRISFRNRENPTPDAPPWIYMTPTSFSGLYMPMPLWVKSDLISQLNPDSYLCPEFREVMQGGLSFTAPNGATTEHIGGVVLRRDYGSITLSARSSSDSGGSSWQPLRATVYNADEQPNVPRSRTLGGLFNSTTHQKDFTGTNLGVNTFVGGNQAFGSSLFASFWVKNGTYTIYGTRGPLSALYTQKVDIDWNKTNYMPGFVIYQDRLPDGWTSFDLPGPSQVTTGGYLPIEKLASALAEGVQVVGNTELDRFTNADATQLDFRSEFDFTGSNLARSAVQYDPFVIGARSSNLNGFGSATTLFTPTPRNEHNGGARDSSTWTLADFQTQGEGEFTIVHRPRGPQGLFTLKNFTPSVVSDSNSWWNAPGHLSLGKLNGQFEAIELLRAESWDPTNPNAWFTEFKQVRNDWFGILNQQTPTNFTKALGLSSANYSLDTPVGLARTYVKAQGYATPKHTDGFWQGDMSLFKKALKTGAAVASTGPLLDVTLKGTSDTTIAPGGLVEGTNAQVTLTVNLWAPDWVPVDELRVVINGTTSVLDISQLSLAEDNWRHYTGTYTLTMPSKDAWVVVEAGVPLGTTGAYRSDSAWYRTMRGIYPIAVTNPIFVDVNGGGYTAPGL